jgi:hypothetical protein
VDRNNPHRKSGQREPLELGALIHLIVPRSAR